MGVIALSCAVLVGLGFATNMGRGARVGELLNSWLA